MAKNIVPQSVQLDMFAEKPYSPFSAYITKSLYDQFLAEFSPFCKDIVRWDVGNFWQVEGLTNDFNRAELEKRKYFRY